MFIPSTCRRVPSSTRILVAVLGLLTLCGCTDDPLPPDVVATYDGGEVTLDEYRSWLAAHRLEDEQNLRRERLQKIALTESMAARAVTRGVDREAETKALIFASENQLLLAALRRHIEEGIEFTDEEARRAFDANPDNAFKPRALRLRNISKRAPIWSAERTPARRNMEAIRAELLGGADFAEMARHESESQNRARGGNMGFVEPAKLRPEIADAVSDLEPGEITEVIGTDDGWVILECFGVRSERRNTFEEVAQTVHSILRRRELNRRMAEFEAEAIESAAATYNMETPGLPSASPDAEVLRFGDLRLTIADLDRALAARRPGAPARHEMSPAELQQVMNRLIFLAAAGERARELGLGDDPKLTERYSWRRREILALREIEAQVRERFSAPAESEVRAYWESNRGRFRHPAEYELSVIRLGSDEPSMRRQRQNAEELVAALRAGETEFEAAARSRSNHPSAASGGDLGWVSRVQLLSLEFGLFDAITNMRPGDFSNPIQDQRKLWIVWMRDTRGSRQMEYQEARARAASKLGNQITEELHRRIEGEAAAALNLRTSVAGPPAPADGSGR